MWCVGYFLLWYQDSLWIDVFVYVGVDEYFWQQDMLWVREDSVQSN